MATLGDRVFDNGLSVLDTEANKILVTSQEATTYTNANSTYALGNSTSLSIAARRSSSIRSASTCCSLKARKRISSRA